MYSLGFIETMGYVPAFQVADTMAKAADVEIVKKGWGGAGLVTIVIKGEISAIHTALDAGADRLPGSLPCGRASCQELGPDDWN